jgi:hypothetical protein
MSERGLQSETASSLLEGWQGRIDHIRHFVSEVESRSGQGSESLWGRLGRRACVICRLGATDGQSNDLSQSDAGWRHAGNGTK